MKIRIYVITILLLYVTHNTAAQNNSSYFEGTVRYRIDYSTLKNEIPIERIKEHSGAELAFTIKNGFTQKCYFKEDGKLLQTRVFDPIKNLNSQYFAFSDTVYQYHPNKNDFNTVEFKYLGDTIIDGITLEAVKVAIVNKFDAQATLTMWYYFNKKLKIDPRPFAKFQEGEWAKIIEREKSILYYFVIDNGHTFIAKYKAVSIENHPVNPNIFKIPKSLVRKSID